MKQNRAIRNKGLKSRVLKIISVTRLGVVGERGWIADSTEGQITPLKSSTLC